MKISLWRVKELGDIFLINGNEVDFEIEEVDTDSWYNPWQKDTAVFRGSHEVWVCSPDSIVELNEMGEGTLKVNVGTWEDICVDLPSAIAVTFKALVRVPITSTYLVSKTIGIN